MVCFCDKYNIEYAFLGKRAKPALLHFHRVVDVVLGLIEHVNYRDVHFHIKKKPTVMSTFLLYNIHYLE